MFVMRAPTTSGNPAESIVTHKKAVMLANAMVN